MSNDDIRAALPHSVDAEQSVLGALLLDNDSVDRLGSLRADDFFVADHRAIFAAIIRALEAGKSIDVLTLSAGSPAPA